MRPDDAGQQEWCEMAIGEAGVDEGGVVTEVNGKEAEGPSKVVEVPFQEGDGGRPAALGKGGGEGPEQAGSNVNGGGGEGGDDDGGGGGSAGGVGAGQANGKIPGQLEPMRTSQKKHARVAAGPSSGSTIIRIGPSSKSPRTGPPSGSTRIGPPPASRRMGLRPRFLMPIADRAKAKGKASSSRRAGGKSPPSRAISAGKHSGSSARGGRRREKGFLAEPGGRKATPTKGGKRLPGAAMVKSSRAGGHQDAIGTEESINSVSSEGKGPFLGVMRRGRRKRRRRKKSILKSRRSEGKGFFLGNTLEEGKERLKVLLRQRQRQQQQKERQQQPEGEYYGPDGFGFSFQLLR